MPSSWSARRLVGFVLGLVVSGAALAGAEGELEVFVREDCPRCADAKVFLADLQREHPGLAVRLRDVQKEPAALEDLRRLASEQGISPVGVPAFHARGRLLVGFSGAEGTGQQLRALLFGGAEAPGQVAGGSCAVAEASCAQPAEGEEVQVPLLGPMSVKEVGLPLFTIAVGLIDGFNPCAMWVLLLLLALLVNVRSRARMLAIGGTFVLVGGIAYFLFMTAWLNLFLLVRLTRAIQVVLGLIALGIGALQLKEAAGVKGGVSLSIPESAKPGIYARARRIVQERSLPAAVAGAAVMAALVNLVELLCTAGLPAVYTHVLTSQGLPRWQYYAYLGLYNVAYLVDDLLVLGIAVITLGRHKLQERGGRVLKLISAAVMLVLGAVLVLRPAWLAF